MWNEESVWVNGRTCLIKLDKFQFVVAKQVEKSGLIKKIFLTKG